MYEMLPERARQELLADLRSTSWQGDRERSARAWASRPGILRRIALELAALVPADTDVILAAGPAACELGTAVSLTCGIRFAVVDAADTATDEHARPSAVVVSLFGDEVRGTAAGRGDVGGLCLFGSERSTSVSAVFEDDWNRPQHRQRNGAGNE